MTPVLEVQKLTVEFPAIRGWPESHGHWTRVVDEVDLTIARGEILALVGESGSGKTMTALALGGLLPPAARVRVQVSKIQGRLGYVFQDPATSLNPVMTVGAQLVEAAQTHARITRAAALAAAIEALKAVQLPDPAEKRSLYPHQLSGGMQQRVMLAMALLLKPALLVADEPTTALDATVQAQILQLLLTLRRQSQLSILLITHDLLQVAPIADRIAVMTRGHIVETGSTTSLYAAPTHPHTQALLRAMPKIGEGRWSVTR